MFSRLVRLTLLLVVALSAAACGLPARATPMLVPTSTTAPSETAALAATVAPRATPTLVPTATPVPTPTVVPAATPPATPPATPIPGERQEARVVRVVDGDTIVVEMDGSLYRVRYIGIDTPETHHPSEGASYLGYEATDANLALVGEGTTVVLQRDISETDQYGRLLRYVVVGDTLVNAELVQQGLARVRFYEPDVLYQSEMEEALAEARQAKIGLHGPRPTRPADPPLLRTGDAWTTAPADQSVSLLADAARGEPVTALPAGIEVRVVDAFWVPEAQEWWYWIGVNDFNGWTTGEYITKVEPSEVADGPAEPFVAYDWLETTQPITLYAGPDQSSRAVAELAAGTSAQVKGLSWDEPNGAWWYYVECGMAAGWALPDALTK